MKSGFRIIVLIIMLSAVPAFAGKKQQLPPGGLPPGIPPEAMEQIRKLLPPGVQLPPGLGTSDAMSPTTRRAVANGNPDSTGGETSTPLPPEQTYTPVPDSGGSSSPFGSGRTLQQREAAVFAVNAELDLYPYFLPQLITAPSLTEMLKLASERNAAARKKFSPEGLSAYSRSVTWTVLFDNSRPDPTRARQYSLLVSTATNYFSDPHYIMALATAVFALDPQSSVNANNYASAVVSSGERLHAGPLGVKDLSPYRRDAEAIYHYALARSIRKDSWGEESFTPILNLGYLYIDMGRVDEARSLFQVARKLKPYNWDAAKAMATYFHAIGQPDKALAILEDPKLDKPMMLMVAKKAAKVLEKSEPYAGLPADSPSEKFAEGIKVVNSEPIATAADFVAQLDQSERNKMRYFVEHLPTAGSFTAPKVNKLTQYASLQAINSPHGKSALKEFGDMLQNFSLSKEASIGKEQLKTLSRIGLDMNLGVDLDDVAKNPQKYTSKAGKMKPKVKVDKSKLKENIKEWQKLAQQGRRELATGKTAALTELVSSVDPFHAIVAMNPDDYADPMNIIIQKHNYAVHNRKTNLYNGYLYSENKKILQAVQDDQKRYATRLYELQTIRDNKLKELEESDNDSCSAMNSVYEEFCSGANAAGATAFGSATNVATTAYVSRIKPMTEAYYYDVIRHVGLISDPDVRDKKDADLRQNINSALTQALSTVQSAYGFRHYNKWECTYCSEAALEAERKAEREEFERAEEERIARNKAGKAAFDSKDIPPSTPLWKKLDAFGTDLNIPGLFFLKGRISCARTEVRLDTSILPIPNMPELFAGMTKNEFTGATNYEGGVNVQLVDRQVGADGRVTVNVGLSGSVSTDGNGVVQDYSVTPSGEVTVKSGDSTVSVKGEATFGSKGTSVSGEASWEQDGTSVKVGGSASSDGSYTGSAEASAGDGAAKVGGSMSVDKDGKVTTTAEASAEAGGTSVSGKATMDSDGNTSVSGNATVKTGSTTVTVDGQASYGPNGEMVDSDFSAGVSSDMKNGFGSSGKASVEASTKRGCTVSGELKGSIMPSDAQGKDVDKSSWENITDKEGNVMTGAFAEKPVTDKFHKKTLWSGKFCTKKEECEKKN